MSSTIAADLYRVVLVTPKSSAEIALPASVPVGDLLPALVHHSGAGEIGTPDYERGWVLQRLGEAPLDEEATPAALGIREGETLHLRPVSSQLPAARFDDLIDGVAVGMALRTDQWNGRLTRWLFLSTTALALALGLWMSWTGGQLSTGVAAGAMTVVLLLGATACSRALDDRPAALLLALSAIAYAGMLGLVVPAVPGENVLSAPNLLCAGVAIALTAAMSIAAVGNATALFGSIAMGSAGLVIGGLLGTVAGLSGVDSAALVLGLALIMSTLVPKLAFRMARMQLPMLPTGTEDLNDDIEPIPGPDLLARTRTADSYLTGMFLAIGAICAGAVMVVALGDGWLPPAIVAATAGLLIIRSRVLQSGWQRLGSLAPAGFGMALLAYHASNQYTGFPRVAVLLLPLLVVASVALAFSHVMPDRKLHPIWGRLADIAEWIFAIALVPLILAEVGVFAWARAIGG